MGAGTASGPHVYTVPVESARTGETAVLRNPLYTAGLMTTSTLGHNTVCQLYTHCFSSYPGKQCFGSKVEGTYVYKTYREVEKLVDQFGAGLREIVHAGSDGLAIAGLYGKNREEWVIADAAMTLYGVISVPLYDTLGKESILHVLKQTEMSVVVTSAAGAASLLKALPEKGRLRVLVVWEAPGSDLIAAAEAFGVEIVTFEEIKNRGKARPSARIEARPTDIWTISYTSGTTGTPKGVLTSHQAHIIGISGINERSQLTGDEIHLSWLPLAHSIERNQVTLFMYLGALVVFSSCNPLQLFVEVAEVRPTYFCAVPRVWKKIHDILRARLQGLTGVKAALARNGLQAKLKRLHRTGLPTDPVWDQVVFASTRTILGDRCRMAVSGGAPIAQEVLDFLKVTLCIPFLEGYGQTECPGCICLTHPRETASGHVGGPSGGLELKLVDVPELEFFASSQPPSGEVCIRGPLTFSGYYKAPDLTGTVKDREGWVHTGDIATLLDNGAIKIIDRRKVIFKLSQGEYVAPEKVERVLSNCPLLSQVWLYGDSLQDYCLAFVVPDEMALPKWAAAVGLQGDFASLCREQRLADAIAGQFEELGKAAGLMSFELPKRVRLLERPFSIELDQITPTLKVKREFLKKYFQREIEEEYAKGPVKKSK